MLYKKASWTMKLRLPRFFANLHNVKNSKMNRTFERLTLSTPNLLYSFGGVEGHIYSINEPDWSKNMAATDVFSQWAGLRNDWPKLPQPLPYHHKMGLGICLANYIELKLLKLPFGHMTRTFTTQPEQD